MKIFLHNKKIPLIPSLFYENRFITDFKEKAELFNCFFSKQCSLLTNHSELSTSLSFQTNKPLSSATFLAEDIGKIIQGLDHNKAHGHGNINIRMLKICGDTICKPLEMIYSQVITSGSFPSECKKGNIVPIHKKNDKQNLISQSLCYLFVVKFLKELFLTKCLGFFWKTNLLHLTNPVLNQVIHV